MKTVEKIESNIKDLKFGYIDRENDQFIEIEPGNVDSIAKKLGCSGDLLELLLSTFEVMQQAIHDDLADIWEKVN